VFGPDGDEPLNPVSSKVNFAGSWYENVNVRRDKGRDEGFQVSPRAGRVLGVWGSYVGDLGVVCWVLGVGWLTHTKK